MGRRTSLCSLQKLNVSSLCVSVSTLKNISPKLSHSHLTIIISLQGFTTTMSAQIPTFIDIDSSSSPDTTPLKPIFCVKNKDNVKDLETREDCFILEFDPTDVHDSEDKLTSSVKKNLNGAFDFDGIAIVSEKGQVACRDYPHSRHLCVKFPFDKTGHDLYCKLCHCYVCDVSAPCKSWNTLQGHCHAFNNEAWESQRKRLRRANKPQN